MLVQQGRCGARLLILAVLSLSWCGPGCGSRIPAPEKDDSRDPTAYASVVKTRVVWTLRGLDAARRDEALLRLENLRRGLAQYGENPVESEGSTYEELLRGTDELIALYQRSAPARETQAKIATLLATAETLPGELAPMTPQ